MSDMPEIDKELERVEKKIDEHSLAYDILQDLKAANKRLWITLIIVLALWSGTIAGFIWYLNQYDYSSTITVDSKDAPAFYQEGKGNTIDYGTDNQNQDPR